MNLIRYEFLYKLPVSNGGEGNRDRDYITHKSNYVGQITS